MSAPLTLRPSIYKNPTTIVAYEVEGMPEGQRASIVRGAWGDWEVLWTTGDRRQTIRAKYVTPEAALDALIAVMRPDTD